MSTHYIPPADKRTIALGKAREAIEVGLRPYIKGRRGSQYNKNMTEAVEAVIQALSPLLKLPSKPDKGATIMTEGASARNPHTGDFSKKPEIL